MEKKKDKKILWSPRKAYSKGAVVEFKHEKYTLVAERAVGISPAHDAWEKVEKENG